MASVRIQSALISVFYKDGLEPIIQQLAAAGIVIYSTGGTYDFITNLGHSAIRVEDITGYPSIFGGRVKTLHPKVFGGILHRRHLAADLAEATTHQIPAIDLVIVDLYPFAETIAAGGSDAECVEKIDIGGVSLLRAAAKNHADVLVISSKNQYHALEQILVQDSASTTLESRRKYAAQAIATCSLYDLEISCFLAQKPFPDVFATLYGESTPLRYGENPHQKAAFLGPLHELFTQLNGKELSYNNLLDLDAGLSLMRDFEAETAAGSTTCAILKHNNACGLAMAASPLAAWDMALAADPVSAFGGVIFLNAEIDLETALAIDKIFFEILVAPSFAVDALALLRGKKNRILLQLVPSPTKTWGLRSMLNGLALQENDLSIDAEADMKVVTVAQPSPEQRQAMLFAARVCKHTRSNAIVLAEGGRLIASGMGQTSRVDALQQAISKAKGFNFALERCVMASDAFFPFPDCVEIAHKAGVMAVIQPGGSIKDQDSVAYCNLHGIVMITTGRRHFKH